MNKNLTIEQAEEIFKLHAKIDNKIVDSSLDDYKFSDLEICTGVLVKVLVDKTDIKTMSNSFGCEIIQNGRNYTFLKGNERIDLEKMPEEFLMQIKSQPNQCHKNCFNCCFALSDINDGYVCTGEVYPFKTEKGILHSFIEFGDNVFDVTYGFVMDKNLYHKCFNVFLFSKTRVGDVKRDIDSGVIAKLKNANYSTYFMARDEYVRKLNNHNENKKLAD